MINEGDGILSRGEKQLENKIVFKELVNILKDGQKNEPELFEELKNIIQTDKKQFSKLVDMVEEGQKNEPTKFKKLKTILLTDDKEYSTKFEIELFIKIKDNPAEMIGSNDNDFLNQNTKINLKLTRANIFQVYAIIKNPNPIEMRKIIYLELGYKEPGNDNFEVLDNSINMILPNQYKGNTAKISFPKITSFSHLKNVGPVFLSLKIDDGFASQIVYSLPLNITNLPPKFNNATLLPKSVNGSTGLPRYSDQISYFADINDPDGDPLNITLHICDSLGKEKANYTQIIKSGYIAEFSNKDYSFFDDSDSGKSFNYYYSYDDGISNGKSDNQDGPHLRNSTTIWVDSPQVTPEDNNWYWWQNYKFSLRMKNLGPTNTLVSVTLFIDTVSNPSRFVDTKSIILTNEPQTIYFNASPFQISDINKSFKFKFKYSESDQNANDKTEIASPSPINARITPYGIISLPIGINIFLLICILFLICTHIGRDL
jgi:hypothetical protein